MAKSSASETTRHRSPDRQSWQALFFIARRYLKNKRKERRRATAVLAILGLVFGTAVLITVISIMNGFQANIIESLVDVESFELRIYGAPAAYLAESPSKQQALVDAVPGVSRLFRFDDADALSKSVYYRDQSFRVRALNLGDLRSDPAFSRHLRLHDSGDLNAKNGIVLGYYLSRRLGLTIGSTLAMTIAGNLAEGNAVQELKFTVTGIFDSEYPDFDEQWSFVSLESYAENFRQPRYMAVRLRDRSADMEVLRGITSWFEAQGLKDAGSDVESYREYNAMIFGALRTEKLLMFFLVGLMFVVVAVNIHHGLRRSVLEKHEDMAVLRAMGASSRAIRLVFIVEGLIIGAVGAGIGFILGLVLSLNADALYHGFEAIATALVRLFNPDASSVRLFFIDTLNARLYLGEAIGIGIFALASALCAAIIASRPLLSLKPAQILRGE